MYFKEDKVLYETFKKNKTEIEIIIKEIIEWKDENKVGAIFIKKDVEDVFDEKYFEEYFKWFYEKIVLI